MMTKKERRFCGEHARWEERENQERDQDQGQKAEQKDRPRERVQCPWDEKHTCDREKLKKHMKKCR